MTFAKTKRFWHVVVIYSFVTLGIHWVILFMRVYMFMLPDSDLPYRTIKLWIDKLPYYAQNLTLVFYLFCLIFMAVAAFMLVFSHVSFKEYFYIHSIFWLMQFAGFDIFRRIMSLITVYASMDLYGRFIVLASYKIVPILLYGSLLIRFVEEQYRKRKVKLNK